jgi:hypothetical protein
VVVSWAAENWAEDCLAAQSALRADSEGQAASQAWAALVPARKLQPPTRLKQK